MLHVQSSHIAKCFQIRFIDDEPTKISYPTDQTIFEHYPHWCLATTANWPQILFCDLVHLSSVIESDDHNIELVQGRGYAARIHINILTVIEVERKCTRPCEWCRISSGMLMQWAYDMAKFLRYAVLPKMVRLSRLLYNVDIFSRLIWNICQSIASRATRCLHKRHVQRRLFWNKYGTWYKNRVRKKRAFWSQS